MRTAMSSGVSDPGGRRAGLHPERGAAPGATPLSPLRIDRRVHPAQLASLYGTQSNYIAQYTKSLDKAIADGYILRPTRRVVGPGRRGAVPGDIAFLGPPASEDCKCRLPTAPRILVRRMLGAGKTRLEPLCLTLARWPHSFDLGLWLGYRFVETTSTQSYVALGDSAGDPTLAL